MSDDITTKNQDEVISRLADEYASVRVERLPPMGTLKVELNCYDVSPEEDNEMPAPLRTIILLADGTEAVRVSTSVWYIYDEGKRATVVRGSFVSAKHYVRDNYDWPHIHCLRRGLHVARPDGGQVVWVGTEQAYNEGGWPRAA